MLHETGAVLEMLFNVLVFLRFEGAILKNKTLHFFLVGVASLDKKIQERDRQRGGRDNLLILAVSGDGKVVLDRVLDWLLRISVDQGRHSGIGGSLFDSSCGAILFLIFGLTGRQLGGKLGGDGSVRWSSGSTGGLFIFRHGCRRVGKVVCTNDMLYVGS